MSTVATMPKPGSMLSVEEFLALPDDGIHRELIRGQLKERGMTARNRFHSSVLIRLGQLLSNWLQSQPKPRGQIVGGEAGFRLKGTKESLVGIDVAYVSAELVAATGPRQKIFDGAPVLAIEILSSSDTIEDIVELVDVYHEVGTTVWVVDPQFRTVTVHRPGREPETFNVLQDLSGEPELPGFQVAVRQIFEE
jgi:Uma2 family endonuclease